MSKSEYSFNAQKVNGGYIVEGEFPKLSEFGIPFAFDTECFRKVVMDHQQLSVEFTAWLFKVEAPTASVLNE
jgi:hypothetical protein